MPRGADAAVSLIGDSPTKDETITIAHAHYRTQEIVSSRVRAQCICPLDVATAAIPVTESHDA